RIINPTVARLGTYAWKLIGIGLVGWAVLKLLNALWVLVLAGAVAMPLGRRLAPIARRLRERGWRRGLVASVTLFGFLALFIAIMSVLVPSIVAEFSDLGPTLENA